MIFTQHYLDCLSQASYLIGDESTGRAVVVDPRRDIDEYLSEAAEHGLHIERVVETHIHADFLSGHLELAAATGAVISYGKDADVEFPVEPLHDGQRISLGDVTLEILATPGHTPESICIVVYEHADDEVPYGVLTGDTLFVGDVGRPDLLADNGLSAETLARSMYQSLHEKLLKLPDATRVFPAHGAGSSCGKNLSSETSSTIGEQRRTNYALQIVGVERFVATLTEDQPPRPRYFEFDSVRNREQHPLRDDSPPPLLDIDDVCRHAAVGAILLDGREEAEYARGHLRGAVNVGLQGRFAESVGIVVSPDSDIVLVGDSGAMTVLGYASTVPVSTDEMLMLAAAVRRGLQTPLLVGDLPFGSYEASDTQAVETAQRFIKEAGCDAVKLERGGTSVQRARAIVDAGIPVMGHVGLTPQTATALGGYKAQGRTADRALTVARDAIALQEAGCFSIVLEAIPAAVTEILMSRLEIPVIGIGAGAATDGQVLVFHDLLGIYDGHAPRFAKRFQDVKAQMVAGVAEYAAEVRAGAFPAPEHSYSIDEDELRRFEQLLD